MHDIVGQHNTHIPPKEEKEREEEEKKKIRNIPA